MTDTGTGYGRPAPTFMRELTLVGPGTPMGELLRRYWHPVGLAGDATDTPKALRVLCEDLVLFRDRQGRPGLVTAPCAHRGTTRDYRRVEQPATRRRYPGWPFHVEGSFSGPQFTAPMGLMPEVTWELSDRGVKAISDRRQPDGTVLHRISEAVLPTLRVIPNPRVAQYARVETIGWVLPLDDTSFRNYTAGRVRSPGEIASVRSRLNGKLWEELSAVEHRDFPGDYEAQVGQGPITLHSEENLVSSDRGVALVRSLLKLQLDALAAGRDPIGVSFDAAAPPVPFDAGNFLIERPSHAPRPSD